MRSCWRIIIWNLIPNSDYLDDRTFPDRFRSYSQVGSYLTIVLHALPSCSTNLPRHPTARQSLLEYNSDHFHHAHRSSRDFSSLPFAMLGFITGAMPFHCTPVTPSVFRLNTPFSSRAKVLSCSCDGFVTKSNCRVTSCASLGFGPALTLSGWK